MVLKPSSALPLYRLWQSQALYTYCVILSSKQAISLPFALQCGTSFRDYWLSLVHLKHQICDEEALRKGKYPRLMDGEQCNDPNEAVHFPCLCTPANEDAIVLRRPTFRVVARSRPNRTTV